ncbi:hypothetical protein [Thalassobius sp. I31.1]|uniref:hypothetical protein n=1 Tax=Thalassobius sp. I31.1 TaxID=2109912 RepID=UPI000D1A0E4D|nr:hypothetical protein [Thalassobius sp. I31.1]
MVESHNTTPIADKVSKHLYEHPGSPGNVPKAVNAWRVGIYDYVCSSRLGEHLNNYLFEGVSEALDQFDYGLTDAQKTSFLEYLHEQVPEFEADIGAFIDAYSRDFDSVVAAYIETLISSKTNVH